MAKILFVSSAGGHFNELMQLKPLMEKHDSIIVSEKINNNHSLDYSLVYGTRSNLIKYLFVFSINSIKALNIIRKEKPNMIISTGAHSCVPFFFIGKLFKIKLIYIESYAKVNSPSLTYKIIKSKANKVIVQHKDMTKVYEEATYLGGVY